MRRRPWKRYAATTAIITGGLFTGYHYSYGTETLPSGITANLFIVPASSSDGSTTCVRSATPVTYAVAQAASPKNVCKYVDANTTSWDKGCSAATAGDDVGVMPGVYTNLGSGNYLMGAPQATGQAAAPYNCADGGSDYNPNWREQGLSDPSSVLSSWVNFKPGVDCSGTPNISFAYESGTATFASGDWHLIIGSRPGDTTSPGGECFNFNRTIYMHDRNSVVSSSNARPGNILFRGKSQTEMMQMYGLEIRGAKNVLFENIDYGPNVQCAGNDANATPAYFRCDPSGAYFESPYAAFGNLVGCTGFTTLAKCGGTFDQGTQEFAEVYIHNGSWEAAGPDHYNNIRLHQFLWHDGQVKGSGSQVHPGCFLLAGGAQTGMPAHNLVFDEVTCERQVIGVQHADAGVTVQNSYFGCPVVGLDTSSPQGEWDECAGQVEVRLGCRGDLQPGCTQTDVLYRYNVFFSNPGASALLMGASPAGNYSNVRVVGNIFIGAGLVGCGTAGVTCENNSFYGVSTAGSDATTLSCDPTIDSEQATPDHLWRETTQLNPRLNGSSCGVPLLNPAALGTDYQLGFDIDGDARGSTSTHAGAEN
jgi:hypothetical protein